MELIFEVRDAEEGGFYARALGHSIFTEGETWDELRTNALEAVALHFEDHSALTETVGQDVILRAIGNRAALHWYRAVGVA